MERNQAGDYAVDMKYLQLNRALHGECTSL